MHQHESAKPWDPSETYALLDTPHTSQKQLALLLLSQIAPFLPGFALGTKKDFQKMAGEFLGVHQKVNDRFPELVSRHPVLPPTFDDMNAEYLWFLGVIEQEIDIRKAFSFRSDPLLVYEKKDENPNANFSQTVHGANQEFAACLREANEEIDKLCKSYKPDTLSAQATRPLNDMGAMTFHGLLSAYLDRNVAMRRRFEALRLLQWALGLYAIRKNPFYKSQREARQKLLEALNKNVWSTEEKYIFFNIPDELLKTIVEEEEAPGHTATGEPVALQMREVSEQVKTVLAKYKDVLEIDDAFVSESREKSAASLLIKILQLREDVRACEASVLGREVPDWPLEKAQKKLEEFKKLTRQQHAHAGVSFSVKPVSYEVLDDQVAMNVVVILKKRLDDFTPEERGKIDNLFLELANLLRDAMNLEVPEAQNRLWGSDPGNPKSAKGFRVFKLHGLMEIGEQTTADLGFFKTVKSGRIPIEIQLQPLESYVRGNLKGKTGHEGYDQKKRRNLQKTILPKKIGRQEVYPL